MSARPAYVLEVDREPERVTRDQHVVDCGRCLRLMRQADRLEQAKADRKAVEGKRARALELASRAALATDDGTIRLDAAESRELAALVQSLVGGQ